MASSHPPRLDHFNVAIPAHRIFRSGDTIQPIHVFYTPMSYEITRLIQRTGSNDSCEALMYLIIEPQYNQGPVCPHYIDAQGRPCDTINYTDIMSTAELTQAAGSISDKIRPHFQNAWHTLCVARFERNNPDIVFNVEEGGLQRFLRFKPRNHNSKFTIRIEIRRVYDGLLPSQRVKGMLQKPSKVLDVWSQECTLLAAQNGEGSSFVAVKYRDDANV